PRRDGRPHVRVLNDVVRAGVACRDAVPEPLVVVAQDALTTRTPGPVRCRKFMAGPSGRAIQIGDRRSGRVRDHPLDAVERLIARTRTEQRNLNRIEARRLTRRGPRLITTRNWKQITLRRERRRNRTITPLPNRRTDRRTRNDDWRRRVSTAHSLGLGAA